MPLDLKPEKRAVSEETEDGRSIVRIVDAWVPHWGTCPPLAEGEVPLCWPGYSASTIELATAEADFELTIGGKTLGYGGEEEVES